MEAAHRKHLEVVREMQSHLERYAGSYDDLAQQNAELRSRLEVATRHIQMLRWTSAVPPGGPPMQAPWALPGAGWQMPAASHGTKHGIAHGAKKGRSSHVGGAPKLPSMPEEVESDLDDEDDEGSITSAGSQGQCSDDAASLDFRSPLASSGHLDPLSDDAQGGTVPMTPPRQLRPSAKQTQMGSGSRSADGSGGKLQGTPSTTTPGSADQSPIALTLRRVDGQPLGLEVRPDTDLSCLHVERIQPGTVVEAWNRQCKGEPRTILPGDRVVSVNGATKPDDMRKEFGQKLLLKLELVR
jgi:hypothetical protein